MKVMAFLIICLTAACAANTLLVNNLFMYRQPDYTTPAPVVYQTNSFLIFGDSKSTPDNLQSQLEVNMNARSPVATNRWVSAPVRIANAGYSAYIYVHVADLAAILAARTTNTPTYIFLNLGANDVNGDVNDVHNFDTNGITWKTNMAFILDALHTKWASAEIYQMLPWKQGSTYSNKLWLLRNTYIPQVHSGRSWCHIGPDESVFLENGDDGVTYLSDGLHPNVAGQNLTAQKWAETVFP